MKIKITLIIFIISLFFSNIFLFADLSIGSEEIEPELPGSDSNKKNKDSIDRKVNVDMQLVYGQYNNMFSTINFSHEQKDFVYLLNSYFKRSNDYGFNNTLYENSNYYENNLGFTGNLNLTGTWKMILDAGIENDSHGMFDNVLYGREEKEKYSLSMKNINKFSSSFEGLLFVKGTGYTHRLDGREAADNANSNLQSINAEAGVDYIWSASNRIKSNFKYIEYKYSRKDIEKDQYWRAEISDDFIITNYVGVSLGIFTIWNKDTGYLEWENEKKSLAIPLLPSLGLSLRGMKYISMVMHYKYDLKPYMPEEYFYAQKYVLPVYELPAAKVHQGNSKLNVRFNDIFSLNSEVNIEQSDNFYNYHPVEEDLLSIHTIKTTYYQVICNGQLNLFKDRIGLIIGYQYQNFKADENITYRPEHNFNGTIRYKSKKINFEWTNKILGKVYTDPLQDEKLDRAIIGILGLQYETISGLYAYVRIENLYNNQYFLRENYPEAGRTFLGGLRILI